MRRGLTPTIADVPTDNADERRASEPLSALPSRGARALAFVSIILAGLAGGLIGYSLVSLQCSGECAVGKGLGSFVGAVLAALGMAVVAVLVLRASGEWREVRGREAAHRPFTRTRR